jgi:4-hydroxysphinganine ceramide fatty acyl 2-hydroxylase
LNTFFTGVYSISTSKCHPLAYRSHALKLDSHLPDNRVGITLHFLLHGIHHYLPMDKYRLVMPPTLFVALAAPFWKFAHTVIFWNWYAATAAYAGGVFGYTLYDMTHYFLHHQK